MQCALLLLFSCIGVNVEVIVVSAVAVLVVRGSVEGWPARASCSGELEGGSRVGFGIRSLCVVPVWD